MQIIPLAVPMTRWSECYVTYAHDNMHRYRLFPVLLERCEAGDLAGKLGRLNTTNQPFSRIDNTSTLFLRNQYSIIGRSVVIHRPDNNANFVCGTIRSAAEMSGRQHSSD